MSVPTDSSDDIEQDDEHAKVVDPDQYTQSRRLEQIHNARDRIPEVRRQGYELWKNTTHNFGPREYRRHVAEAVIDYGIELEPVIARSDSDILDRSPPNSDTIIRQLLDHGGRINGDPIPIDTSRWVRRQFDHFMAEVGLGVELDDQNDTWQI